MLKYLKSHSIWWWALLTVGILLPVFSFLLCANGLMIFQTHPFIVQSLTKGKLLLSSLIFASLNAMLAVGLLILWLRSNSNEQSILKELSGLKQYLKQSDLQINELREQNDMLAAMREISRVLARDVNLQVLLSDVMKIIRDYAEPESAAIYLPEDKHGYKLNCALISGKVYTDPDFVIQPDSLIALTLERRQVQKVVSSKRVVFYIPFELEENSYGVFQISREIEDPGYQHIQDYGVRISNFIQHIALVVKHITLFDRATRDGLTRLYNRRYFDLQLERLVAIAERKHTPLSMILIDIDHFKNVNDDFGHQTGDIILRNVADIVNKEIRQMDGAYRYGGEEIVVLLPQTKLDESYITAERIRNTIEQHEFTSVNDDTLRITISIGVGELGNRESRVDFIERIDEALYNAKDSGRNQTCIAAKNLSSQGKVA